MNLQVLLQLSGHLEVLAAGLAGVDLDACQLLAVLLQMQGQLAVQDELVPTLRTDKILLFLVKHDVGFETGHARELLLAHRAGGVGGGVGGLVEGEVELHVEGLWTLVTPVRLIIGLVVSVMPLQLALCAEALGAHRAPDVPGLSMTGAV